MDDNKDFISPNEINKFVYCPYQWYYEKTIGTKQLRRLYMARNEALGLSDTQTSNYNKGSQFHSQYRLENPRMFVHKLLRFAFLLLVLAAVCVGYYVYFKAGG